MDVDAPILSSGGGWFIVIRPDLPHGLAIIPNPYPMGAIVSRSFFDGRLPAEPLPVVSQSDED